MITHWLNGKARNETRVSALTISHFTLECPQLTLTISCLVGHYFLASFPPLALQIKWKERHEKNDRRDGPGGHLVILSLWWRKVNTISLAFLQEISFQYLTVGYWSLLSYCYTVPFWSHLAVITYEMFEVLYQQQILQTFLCSSTKRLQDLCK